MIQEYILDRTALFPDDTIRPKHHYLLHYPKLILQLGPMIRLWTLIFESKHTFFKECSRKLKNFKHLTSTIANRHQLLQAYYHAGDLFPARIISRNTTDFALSYYNTDIQRAVGQFNFSPRNTLSTTSMTYNGTTYKKIMVVIVGKHDNGYEI